MDAGSARPCGRGGRWAVRGLASAGLALWALCATAPAAERVALVIGNGAYEHVKRLPNPGHDATDVGAAFERLGYAVTRVGDAGFDALRRGLLDFTRAASASEVAVVFYAGHGIEVDGRNFLVPVDARLARDQDVEFEAVPLALVTRAVGGARRLGLVVLDACRDNPFVAKLAKEGAKRSIGRGLARVAPAGGTLVAYAAEDGETADDGDGRNSPYTGALLRYLEEPGLEVGRLFRKVRAEVERTTGGSQTPVEYGKLPDADIYLASAAAPPPPPGGAKEAFEVAERVGTVAAYRVVVEEFPGTTYARFAQAWIDKHAEEPLVVAGGEAADEATSPPPPPEAVERGLGLSREERGQVQMGLAAAGHDPGPVDGMIGRGTREAIRRWQRAQGKPATGYLDADGAKALLALGERKAKEAEAAARRARAAAERKAREAEARRRAEAEARRKRARRPGDTFRDCPECPEMVVVPAGRFEMGSPASEADRHVNEGPVHRVTFARPFAVGVHEVTRGEFARFVSATGRSMGACNVWDGKEWKERSGSNWKMPGFSQTDAHPVVCVNWNDAKAYVRWLSGRTGEEYRLLSEAEWEYVARAGTRTARYWGEGESGQCRYANGADRTAKRHNSGWTVADCDDGHYLTAPVGSFHANGYKLHDVLGNVWEWTEDCWNESYDGAPRDGSAWESGSCGRRVLRGGSWIVRPRNLRSANRYGNTTGGRSYIVGFRVARTLTP